MSDTTDFLAHYGVKGMKWGVTRTSPNVKVARKEARKAGRRALDAKLIEQFETSQARAVSMGKLAVTTNALDHAARATIGADISRAAGFSKGKTAALAVLGGGPIAGPLTAAIAAEVQIRRNVRANVK